MLNPGKGFLLKVFDYSRATSLVSMKLLQKQNRPLFKKKKVQHALYLPRILSPPEISIPFHHFPSFVQVKGHLPLLETSTWPTPCYKPLLQLPSSSPAPTRDSISVTGTWYTRDQITEPARSKFYEGC